MSRETEIADGTLDDTIVVQAFAAALAYPELKIVCPWHCGESVFGVRYAEHARGHLASRSEAPDHWWAL